MKQLYIVDCQIIIPIAVVAESRSEATQIAHDSFEDELANQQHMKEVVGVRKIESEQKIPGEWKHSLPYGTQDDHRRNWTCSTWFEKDEWD